MKKLDVVQRSDEWLALRREKIGASDAATICGVDQYKTAARLWEEKMNGKSQTETSAMQRGNRLEPIARNLVEKTHNTFYEADVYQSSKYDWMIASLDGYSESDKKMIEIKCPGENVFNQIVHTNEIPKNWIYQMQHQMCVMELQECTLIVFNGDYFLEFKVDRDEEVIDEIIVKELAFYQSMVNHIQPEAPVKERTDEDVVEAMQAYIDARNARIDAEELEKICKDSLIYLANDEPFQCKGVTVRKVIRPGNIDYNSIEAIKGIDLTPYRKKPTEYWRIS